MGIDGRVEMAKEDEKGKWDGRFSKRFSFLKTTAVKRWASNVTQNLVSKDFIFLKYETENKG